MSYLFAKGTLHDFLTNLISAATDVVRGMEEEALLARSADDLVAELVQNAHVEPLAIDTDDFVTGSVDQTTIDTAGDIRYFGNRATGLRIQASYAFTGDPRLFYYRPSRHIMKTFEAAVEDQTLTVSTTSVGTDVAAETARAQLQNVMDPILKMVGFVNHDLVGHGERAEREIRAAIERRRKEVLDRRNLAGALGFPLTKRDAPVSVPLKRKQIAVRPTTSSGPYRDEYAITREDFEEAVTVLESALHQIERSPSVAMAKGEEDLRDLLLVSLNGVFQGRASGETFVQAGKTDILLRVEDRHVFVAECKWWTGPAACTKAIDQLLSYLPWRDEKAVLIFFIDRTDATAVIEKAGRSVKDHPSFKRAGSPSPDKTRRVNYVLGQPDDLDREVHLALLFAVVKKGG